MKTFETLRSQKIVSWALILMFSCLQIAPAGWAATPTDDPQALSVPASETPVAEAQAQPAPATLAVPISSDTAFLMSTGGISAPTPVASQPGVVLLGESVNETSSGTSEPEIGSIPAVVQGITYVPIEQTVVGGVVTGFTSEFRNANGDVLYTLTRSNITYDAGGAVTGYTDIYAGFDASTGLRGNTLAGTFSLTSAGLRQYVLNGVLLADAQTGRPEQAIQRYFYLEAGEDAAGFRFFIDPSIKSTTRAAGYTLTGLGEATQVGDLTTVRYYETRDAQGRLTYLEHERMDQEWTVRVETWNGWSYRMATRSLTNTGIMVLDSPVFEEQIYDASGRYLYTVTRERQNADGSYEESFSDWNPANTTSVSAATVLRGTYTPSDAENMRYRLNTVYDQTTGAYQTIATAGGNVAVNRYLAAGPASRVLINPGAAQTQTLGQNLVTGFGESRRVGDFNVIRYWEGRDARGGVAGFSEQESLITSLPQSWKNGLPPVYEQWGYNYIFIVGNDYTGCSHHLPSQYGTRVITDSITQTIYRTGTTVVTGPKLIEHVYQGDVFLGAQDGSVADLSGVCGGDSGCADAWAGLNESERDHLQAALLDIGPNSQFTMQTSLDGSETSWTWTSESDSNTSYSLVRSVINGTEQWQFKATKKEVLPPAVQTFAEGLRSGLNANGDYYTVDVAVQDQGGYLLTVTGQGVGLKQMTFLVDENASVQRNSILAEHAAFGNIDGPLMYDGAQLLEPPVSGTDAMVRAIRLDVQRAEEGALLIRYLSGDAGEMIRWYRFSRDEAGQAKAEQALSPAMEGFADNLRGELPEGFEVNIAVLLDGKYQITVDACPKDAACTTLYGGFGSMSFTVDENGTVDAASVTVSYKGMEGQVDGQLLYEAVEQILNNGLCTGDACVNRMIMPQEIVAAIVTVVVEKVEDGAIYFTRGGKHYKAYKDSTEQEVMEEVFPEVYVPYIPEEAGTFPASLKYYDAGGNLMREVTMSAPDRILSVTEYAPGREGEMPAKVGVYPQDSDQLHSEIYYGLQGNVLFAVIYNYADGYIYLYKDGKLMSAKGYSPAEDYPAGYPIGNSQIAWDVATGRITANVFHPTFPQQVANSYLWNVETGFLISEMRYYQDGSLSSIKIHDANNDLHRAEYYNMQGRVYLAIEYYPGGEGKASLREYSEYATDGVTLLQKTKQTFDPNGKVTLLEVEKYSNGKLTSKSTEVYGADHATGTYYRYDENGKTIVFIQVTDVHLDNSYSYHTARYVSWDVAGRQKTDMFVQGLNVSLGIHDDLTRQMAGWEDYPVIENLAEVKTTSYYEDDQAAHLRFMVVSAKNSNNVFDIRRVDLLVFYPSRQVHSFIVVGEPDVLSNETNDIRVRSGQVTIGDITYDSYFDAAYQVDSQVIANNYRKYTYLGYGLVFRKDDEVHLVDYPANQTVTLKGIEYQIQIDNLGVITTKPTIPSAAEPVADLLKPFLKAGTYVEAVVLESGQIQVTLFEMRDGARVEVSTILFRNIYGKYYLHSHTNLENGVQSEFMYWTDGSQAGLNFIRRTGEDGFFLSGISITGAGTATVELPGGKTRSVQFSSNEELLLLAERFENENPVPDAVRQFMRTLTEALPEYEIRYGGTVEESGRTLYVLGLFSGMARPGYLQSFEIWLDAQGNPDSVTAVVSGIGPVDGQVFYEAVEQILNNGLCTGDACVNRMIMPQEIVAAIVTTPVTKVEDGAIFFTQGGKDYKAYRVDNIVKVEEIVTEPFGIVASTDPTPGSNALSISVASDGSAALVWSDRSYAGTFVPAVNERGEKVAVITATQPGGYWAVTMTVHLIYQEGSWILKDMSEVRTAGDIQQSMSFSFIPNPLGGYLVATTTEASASGTYVQNYAFLNIPDPADPAVIVKVVLASWTYEDNDSTPMRHKNYYHYDAAGNRIGELHVYSSGDPAQYWFDDAANGRIITVSAAAPNLMDQIDQWSDHTVIDQHAIRWQYTYRSDSGDIRFRIDQTRSDTGYQLVFSQGFLGVPLAVVDYPGVDTVEIEGKTYQITIDDQGIVNLTDVTPKIPPAVKAFAEGLSNRLPEGFEVNIAVLLDGKYQITVDACPKDAACTTLYGGFGSMSFTVDENGTVDSASVTVSYKGMEGQVDGSLLYEAMGVCPEGQVCTDQVVEPVDSIVKMTQAIVSKVEEGAIFFTQGGKDYKAYRVDNIVKVEEIVPLPEAVQAVVSQLQGALGDGYSFTAVKTGDDLWTVTVQKLASDTGSELEGMVLTVSGSGVVTLQGMVYSSQGGGVSLNADAAGLFKDGYALLLEQGIITRESLFGWLAQAQSLSVDLDGKIHFKQGQIDYDLVRGSDGLVTAHWAQTLREQDGSGRLSSSLLVEEWITEGAVNARRRERAEYHNALTLFLYDYAGKKITEMQAVDMDQLMISMLLNGFTDVSSVESMAKLKLEKYFGDETFSAGVHLYDVYYERSMGRWTERMVFVTKSTAGFQVGYYIVQGVADVFLGRFYDDIPILLDQQGMAGGIEYQVTYKQAANASGQLRFGLVFDYRPQGGSDPLQTVVVNYPSQNTVTLNGANYHIQIDPAGQLTLIPTLIYDFMQGLKTAMGGNVTVTCVMNADGSANLEITNPAESGLQSLRMKVSADGVMDSSSLAMTYSTPDGMITIESQSPTYYGNLFYWAVETLKDCAVSGSGPGVCQGGNYTPFQVLAAMKQATVFSFDNGVIRFIYGNNTYQADRSAALGTPQIRQAFSVPAQSFLDSLATALPGYGIEYQGMITTTNEGLLYRFRVIADTARPGYFQSFEIRIDLKGDLRSILNATVDQFWSIDGALFYEAASKILNDGLCTGDVCVQRQIMPQEILGAMANIHISRIENRVTYFTMDGQTFKVRRGGDGKMVLEQYDPVVVPFTVQVSTVPGLSPNLTIEVFDDGTVVIQDYSRTYRGVFNTETLSIHIQKSTTATWDLAFDNAAAGSAAPYFLKSLREVSGGAYPGEVTKYFLPSGMVSSWELVSNLGGTVSREKNFFDYDANGQHILTLEVTASRNASAGTEMFSADYLIIDRNGLREITGKTYNIPDDTLYNAVQSIGDLELIRARVTFESAVYYQDASLVTGLYTIEFTRDTAGNFTVPRKVTNGGVMYIVRGAADVLSGETDDELFADYQSLGLGEDYGVFLGESSLSDGPLTYGIVFFRRIASSPSTPSGTPALDSASPETPVLNSMTPVSSSTPGGTSSVGTFVGVDISQIEILAIVDYPAVDTVEIEGKTYKITIDEQGLIVLTEEPSIIYSVEDFVNAISPLASGYKVETKLLAPGRYLVRILDSRSAPYNDGELSEARVIFTIEDGADWSSLLVYYHDKGSISQADARLLFETLHQFPQPILPPEDIDQRCFARLSGVKVTKVESTGTLFTLDGKDYKTSWDAEGNVKVVRIVSIPDAVQTFVGQLKTAMPGWDVGTSLISGSVPPRYLVTMNRRDGSIVEGVAPLIPEGGLEWLSFEVSEQGAMDPATLQGAYNNVNPDLQLLYAAVNQILHAALCNGEMCADRAILPQEVLAAMAGISVTEAEGGTVFFTLDGKNYKAFRDAEGNLKLEIVIPLPLAVQALVDALKEKFGSGYSVTAKQQSKWVWQVKITDSKTYIEAPTSGLKELSFSMRDTGELKVPGTVQAVYYRPGGRTLQGNGSLLYQAMNICPQGEVCSAQVLSPVEVFKRMSELDLTRVSGGANYYTLGGKNYKVYRLNGVVKVDWIKA